MTLIWQTFFSDLKASFKKLSSETRQNSTFAKFSLKSIVIWGYLFKGWNYTNLATFWANRYYQIWKEGFVWFLQIVPYPSACELKYHICCIYTRCMSFQESVFLCVMIKIVFSFRNVPSKKKSELIQLSVYSMLTYFYPVC